MTQPAEASSPYPSPGDVVDDKYVIEKMLGEGGMGAVLRATHKLRKAPVALKFMSPAILGVSGIVERFLNEAVAISKIESEHVVKVFDVSRLPSGQPYIVMEYMKGEDLAGLLAREGTPHLRSFARAVHFTLQILRGLQIAHRAGIVHRDMKPANCFVTTVDDEHDFVKLLDFGISKLEQPDGLRLTAVNSSMGTPLYMSPEQAANPMNVDARSDLYSVACILYELLTARPPFDAASGQLSELLYKLFSTEPTPLTELRPDVPVALAQAISRGLAKDPGHRYQSARDMAEALAPFSDERSADVLRRMLGRRGGADPALSGDSMPAASGSVVTVNGALPGANTLPSAGAGAPAAPHAPSHARALSAPPPEPASGIAPATRESPGLLSELGLRSVESSTAMSSGDLAARPKPRSSRAALVAIASVLTVVALGAGTAGIFVRFMAPASGRGDAVPKPSEAAPIPSDAASARPPEPVPLTTATADPAPPAEPTGHRALATAAPSAIAHAPPPPSGARRAPTAKPTSKPGAPDPTVPPITQTPDIVQ